MNDQAKAIIYIIIFSISAFLLTPVLWPSPVHMGNAPTRMQIVNLVILSVIEALSFGMGMAFLIVGWPNVKKVTGPAHHKALVVYAALAWLLVSWWPHDNLHKVNGDNLGGLIKIEYGFHATLIISAAIVAYQFLKLLVEKNNRAG